MEENNFIYCLTKDCNIKKSHFHCPFENCGYVMSQDEMQESDGYCCSGPVYNIDDFPKHAHCRICLAGIDYGVLETFSDLHIHCLKCNYGGTRHYIKNIHICDK